MLIFQRLKPNSPLTIPVVSSYTYMANIFKTEKNGQYSLLVDEKNIEIFNNSYGLLVEIDENQDDQSIEFSIEIKGKTKKFILN